MKKTQLIIILTLGVFILAGCGKKAVQNNPTTNNSQEKSVTAKPAPEEFAGNVIRNTQAKIISVNTGAIEITTEIGEKLTLKIPQKGASFIKQIKQANGEMLLEDIGLMDISKEKNVDIQYNGQTNEVMMILVK